MAPIGGIDPKKLTRQVKGIIRSAESRGYNTYLKIGEREWVRIIKVRTRGDQCQAYLLGSGTWKELQTISHLDNR